MGRICVTSRLKSDKNNLKQTNKSKAADISEIKENLSSG
jgi:hypothetical protein